MKRLTTLTLAVSALALSAGAASAQSWVPVSNRLERLDERIDAGMRNGDLTRAEAIRLRSEFDALARLEMRYRANGLTAWERSDLDQRYDQLSMRVRFERNDAQEGWYGGRGWTDNRGTWVSIDRRQAQLDQRIDRGLRTGRLTPAEAARLRAEFYQIARVEARYRSGGLTLAERSDLDRRFDRLAARIRWEGRDNQYGYNRYR
ncbi:hypothetical protein [Phenylobacterium sp.]|jgi:hypothetical protein|uniref:hypothetical protein n=1 Tax=Phenylobacterium sp. TaxID=1871053 RepID=UPI002E32D509|nr:hypothetical protein [Phenylobacterium sp.]HEX2562207.1 hypothetical protein [Phenylobacterium sp.]